MTRFYVRGSILPFRSKVYNSGIIVYIITLLTCARGKVVSSVVVHTKIARRGHLRELQV